MVVRFCIILILFVSGCNPSPEIKPTIDNLVGTYTLMSAPEICRLKTPAVSSKITLKKDLSITIENMPDCIHHLGGKTTGELLSGVGTWAIVTPEIESSYGIMFDIAGETTLKAGLYNKLAIEGKEKPFKLIYIIGDPDSMNQLLFERLN